MSSPIFERQPRFNDSRVNWIYDAAQKPRGADFVRGATQRLNELRRELFGVEQQLASLERRVEVRCSYLLQRPAESSEALIDSIYNEVICNCTRVNFFVSIKELFAPLDFRISDLKERKNQLQRLALLDEKKYSSQVALKSSPIPETPSPPKSARDSSRRVTFLTS